MMRFLALLYLSSYAYLDAAFASKQVEQASYLLPNSTSFFVPNGTYRLRVLVVGGGGGGCGGIKQGKGGSGAVVVNIMQFTGPKTVNVSVGKGGLGAIGHSVESGSDGKSSWFGDYVSAAGGRGCTSDMTEISLMKVKGIGLFRCNDITEGINGADVVLTTSSVQGGAGGILINGTGPAGDPGRGNISADGGTGYGAGGGAGGAIYVNSAPRIYPGGSGAHGVVYVEMVHPVCFLPIDIIFAVESRGSSSEFDHQLNYIKNIISNFNISRDLTRVALISYANEAYLKFGFNDFLDFNSLVKGLSAVTNDIKSSTEVQFENVYQTALIAFHESRLSAGKALIVWTFAKNVSQSSGLHSLLRDMKTQGISIAVVAMGNKIGLSSLAGLVEHEHNIYSGNTSHAVPWIAEFICQVSGLKKTETDISDPTFLSTSSAGMTQTVSFARGLVHTSSSSLFYVVPSATAVGFTSHFSSHLIQPTRVTASYAFTASVSKKEGKHKTVEELEQVLNEVLSLNVSTISVDDLPRVEGYISVAGDLLDETYRIPNASERRVQSQILRRIEDIGLTVAEQMRPTETGYKAVKLSSGKVDMAVAAVNISKLEQLRFPDLLGDDFANNSLRHSDKVELPRAAFARNGTELGQVVWMMFNPLTAMKAANNGLASRIMNIIVKPSHKQQFEDPIKMSFWVPKAVRTNVENECAFWDQKTTKHAGIWSTAGCQVAQGNHNDSTVACHCYHLTSFAVLIKTTDYKPKQKHKLPLSIVSCVGCGLSILGCTLTLLTYAFLSTLRSQRHFIHINLVIAILLAQILFLVAAFGVRPEKSQVACYIISVGLFFFFLCVFSWMLAEGIHIYFMVVRVFGSERERKLYYLFIGWGFPFIVTAVVVAIFQSRLLSREICWLSIETGAIWSFVGPAIFAMTVNLIILILVMRVTSKMLNEESPSSVRALAKAFVTLLPILGLTWIFGLLAVNNSSVVFEYLFAVFNSLQGLLIFLFYCLRNTEVTREFRRKLHNIEARRHPNSSSNPSSVPRKPPPEMKCIHSVQDKTAEEFNHLDTKL